VLENGLLRTEFGLTRDDVTGRWKELRDEVLQNLYSPDITMIKSRRLK
jgi:hypothetical protein